MSERTHSRSGRDVSDATNRHGRHVPGQLIALALVGVVIGATGPTPAAAALAASTVALGGGGTNLPVYPAVPVVLTSGVQLANRHVDRMLHATRNHSELDPLAVEPFEIVVPSTGFTNHDFHAKFAAGKLTGLTRLSRAGDCSTLDDIARISCSICFTRLRVTSSAKVHGDVILPMVHPMIAESSVTNGFIDVHLRWKPPASLGRASTASGETVAIVSGGSSLAPSTPGDEPPGVEIPVGSDTAVVVPLTSLEVVSISVRPETTVDLTLTGTLSLNEERRLKFRRRLASRIVDIVEAAVKNRLLPLLRAVEKFDDTT